jgi:hypothetical protein
MTACPDRHGAIGQLRALRHRLRKLTETSRSLIALGYQGQARELTAEAASLTEVNIYIPVRCLLCPRSYPVAVRVGAEGNPKPSVMICGLCHIRIEAALGPAMSDQLAGLQGRQGPSQRVPRTGPAVEHRRR